MRFVALPMVDLDIRKAPEQAQGPDGSEMSVIEVQRNLVTLGYNPGTPDGRLGRNTREAIRQFQRDNGLAVDGQVSPGLGRAIKRALGG